MKATFDVHPGVEWTQRWMAGLKEKTGRTEKEWRAVVRAKGLKDPKKCREWLMKEHGLGSRNAWYFAAGDAEMAWGSDPARYLRVAPGYVDSMYDGKKAGLRPIFEALVKAGRSLGADVKISPCQTMVPFYREFVFAEIHPTNQTRVDLYLALSDAPAKGRLKKSTRRTDDRCTHYIPLESAADVDGFVTKWLDAAYARGNETKKRTKEIRGTPADLAAALKASPKAKATFDDLTPRMRSEWVHWIEDAKQAETRARRIARAQDRLGKGLKGLY